MKDFTIFENLDFQARLLRLLATDTLTLRSSREFLNPEQWQSRDLGEVARGIFAYYDEYSKAPGWDSLDVFMAKGGLACAEFEGGWGALLGGIRSMGEPEPLLRAELDRFIQYRSWKLAFERGLGHLERSEFAMIGQTMAEASRVGLTGEGHIDDFAAGLDSWVGKMVVRDVIPTGLGGIDRAVGGMGRKELTIVLAGTGKGKGMMLCNLGTTAAGHGFSVDHLYTEESPELMRSRYAMCICRAQYGTIHADPKRWIGVMRGRLRGRLRLVNAAGWTAERIKGHVDRSGKPPDMIIIDYPDKFVPPARYQNRRHEIDAIYEQIKSLKQYDMVILTASQTNRAGFKRANVTVADIDESFEKARVADNVLAVCQTDEELEQGRLRVFVAKMRGQAAGFTVNCLQWRDRMLVMDEGAFREEKRRMAALTGRS